MHLYFTPIKDRKKESQLNLVRKIQLLIRACSTPHSMEGYHGDKYPNKTKQIERMLKYEIKGKVAIGCTSREAVDLYKEFLSQKFPERPLSSLSMEMCSLSLAKRCLIDSRRPPTAFWSVLNNR